MIGPTMKIIVVVHVWKYKHLDNHSTMGIVCVHDFFNVCGIYVVETCFINVVIGVCWFPLNAFIESVVFVVNAGAQYTYLWMCPFEISAAFQQAISGHHDSSRFTLCSVEYHVIWLPRIRFTCDYWDQWRCSCLRYFFTFSDLVAFSCESLYVFLLYRCSYPSFPFRYGYLFDFRRPILRSGLKQPQNVKFSITINIVVLYLFWKHRDYWTGIFV